jgi:hypothetical protein
MYENDLANLNNWTGIVEDYDDPLKTGRLRVRINGFHNINKTVLPTTDLPWAMVALPVNGSTTTTGPKVGDWVIGFFFDRESAQLPVVTHVLPGINTVVVKQPIGAPQMPAGQIYDRPGQPSLPPLGRGVVQFTAIDTSNRSRAHVCDISLEVDQTVGAIKNFFNVIAKNARDIFNYVIQLLNLDPTGQFKYIAEKAKEVVRFIKDINRYLKEVKDAINYYITIANKIRAMIDYILNLPAKFAAMFKDCISRLYKILSAGIQSLFPDFGDLSDVAEIANAVSEGIEALNETVNLVTNIAATPAKIGAALLTPSTQEEADEAGKILTQTISENVISNPIEVGAGP